MNTAKKPELTTIVWNEHTQRHEGTLLWVTRDLLQNEQAEQTAFLIAHGADPDATRARIAGEVLQESYWVEQAQLGDHPGCGPKDPTAQSVRQVLAALELTDNAGMAAVADELAQEYDDDTTGTGLSSMLRDLASELLGVAADLEAAWDAVFYSDGTLPDDAL